jgi:hypothetical protein
MWRKRVQGRKTKHEKLRGFKEVQMYDAKTDQ